ncbi:MAG: signal peptidase I [Gemmatimonadetes bacterium]|nr:signal peptidase I [Gemmatimonadota bacterium]
MAKKPAARKANVVAAARGGATRKPTLAENIKGIAGTIAIFLFLRIFLVEAYRIPSGSMIPSMLIGDWLFVNKLAYGPHIPFSSINLPGYAEPKRYDISVFVSPPQVDQPWDPTPTLVKRVVGLPGDTLQMRRAKLFVNGIEQRQGYGDESVPVGDPDAPESCPSFRLVGAKASDAQSYEMTGSFPCFGWQLEHAPRGSRFGEANPTPTHDNWGPLVVPAGHYFMMGDNRYNSKDSRYWGLVPRENFRGRPLFVYYSWDPDSPRALPGLTAIRWGRLGHWIK